MCADISRRGGAGRPEGGAAARRAGLYRPVARSLRSAGRWPALMAGISKHVTPRPTSRALHYRTPAACTFHLSAGWPPCASSRLGGGADVRRPAMAGAARARRLPAKLHREPIIERRKCMVCDNCGEQMMLDDPRDLVFDYSPGSPEIFRLVAFANRRPGEKCWACFNCGAVLV